MNFASVIMSLLLLILLPVLIGSGTVCCGGFRSGNRLTFSWLFGQLIMWSAFQFIAVYNILKERSYETIKKEFVIITLVLCLISAIVFIVSMIGQRRKNREAGRESITGKPVILQVLLQGAAWEKIILALVILGVIVQVILQIVLAYSEVDDSYYVSEATAAIGAKRLYYLLPYTGETTLFVPRHGLAPFPIWLAVIADICGCSVVSMAHVLMPAILLPMTYAVYALFGEILLGDKKRYLPVFMLFTELLTVFGFYSYMTPEKFLITRLREGKATIASLIIPGIIMCLFLIFKSLREDKKVDFRLYIMLFLLNASGCLCSTLGALLCALPIAACAILAIFVLKKGRHILPMVITCLPCAFFAGLYLIL